MLQEFGVVAGLSVVVTFFISLLLIPIIYSYLPPPSYRHLKHTDRKGMSSIINFLDTTVQTRRPIIYGVSLVLIVFGVIGLSKMQPISYMVDDLPKGDAIYSDLKFLESNFKGVMPFEIVINTRRKQGLKKTAVLKKIEELQDRISNIPEISRTVSVVDMLKFGRQAFYNGAPSEYKLPDREEMNFILLYSKKSADGMSTNNLISTIVDSTYAKTRIKGNIKDVGSIRMGEIIGEIQKEINDIFITNIESGELEKGEEYRLFGDEDFEIKYGKEKLEEGDRFVATSDSVYEVVSGEGKVDFADKTKITGTTKIFIKGNEYLIFNLIQSLILAFVVIAILMALLFGSGKMVIISLLPNMMPMLLTAGIMGFAGITLKPSTALIFSVAFGISVDDTIHFLARFRLARKTGDNVRNAVSNAYKDTGISMIYTSIILLLGFGIFAFSTFGSTQALGTLTAITILIALFSNLLLLPTLLLSLNKDTDKVSESYLTDFEEEKEEFEAIKELISSEDAEVNETGNEDEV
ncbi:MAG: MMPL family transporter [Bacteroidia bacterium]|nr:MMPL family transporter [Bacteroidia bacterium]